MRHLLVAALVAGCGGSSKHDTADQGAAFWNKQATRCGHATPELSPALERLSWWLGDWIGDKTEEHWVAAGGALYGIGFDRKGGFDVMIVDDGDGPGKPDGKLRLIAIPEGAPEQTQFDHDGKVSDSTVTFENPQHDFPQRIEYQLQQQTIPDGVGGQMPSPLQPLTAVVSGGDKYESFAWECAARDMRGEALEEADRAFAADTAKRGVDGWVDAFAKDGAMLRRGKRVEGPDAIREAIGPLLASGKLAWAPIASGIAGNVGYTVGKATFVGTDPKDRWKSTYVTIWRSRNDGPWKVVFDTGRVINE
jgi:ketosteroid isomerase-like protein